MDQPSDKWRARNDRFGRFVESVAFRPEVPGYSETAAALDRAKSANPSVKQRIDETVARGAAIFEAFRLNGPGLAQDTYLRNFLAEYNNRLFMGEGIHQPTSWNVLRAFTEPDEKSLALRLLAEEHLTIDLDVILEKLTDPEHRAEWQQLLSLDELTIYNVNLYGGPVSLTVGTLNSLHLSGFSCVREQNELSIMAVLGEAIETVKSSKIPVDKYDLGEGREFLVEGKEEIDTSDIPLLDDDKLRPLVVLMRLDLTDGTVQVRYALEERSDVFHVSADDPDVIIPLIGHPDYDTLRETYLRRVLNYLISSIF